MHSLEIFTNKFTGNLRIIFVRVYAELVEVKAKTKVPEWLPFDIVGKSGKIAVYDPEKIANIEFDVAISESTTTPAYRQLGNDFYMQLLQLGAINVKQLLEFGDFPNGDELLQSIKTAEAEMQNGEMPENITPQQLAELQAAAQGQQVQSARAPVNASGVSVAAG